MTLLRLPDYRGSDESRGYVFPIPYFVYRGEVVKVDRENVRGLLFKTDRLDLDVSVNGSVPVDSSKNAARSGMPDLDPTLEIGPSLVVTLQGNDISPAKTTLHLPLRAVIATNLRHVDSAGWVFNPKINLDLRLPDEWKLGFNAGPIFSNRRNARYFYSVDPAFQTPERPAYDANGGYAGSQFTAGVSRRFRNVWFGAFARINELRGAVIQDSPLVRAHTNFLAGVALSWVFAESTQRVEAEE